MVQRLAPQTDHIVPSPEAQKGIGMPSCMCVTGPVPLIVKSRASCLGGRFPPSFVHQVIVITGMNKL